VLVLIIWRMMGGAEFGLPARTAGRHAPQSIQGVTIMGLKDEVEGKAKEEWGKVTGDKKTETEGKVDQAKGDAKDAVDDVKDAAKQ
jgi:uncharacterized protein YjbJ (UPF0337 family)